MVKDYVRSRKAVTSVSRLHFHPDWQVRLMGDCRAVVEGGGSTLVVQFVGSGCLQVEPSLYCPEFGKQSAGQGLAFSSKGTNVYTGFCISFLPGDLVFDLKTGATISDTQYMW